MAKKSRPAKKKKASSENPLKQAIKPITTEPDNFWSTYAFAILILLALPFLLYLSSMGFEYVLDDKIVITDNSFTKSGLAGIWDILTTESFQGYFGEQKNLLIGGRYRPLSIVTFAIEHQFFGQKPGVSHLNNILLYALSGILLFRVLLMLFPPIDKSKWYLSLAFVASVLFVLHPIHTEVIANIKGRDEILALFFSLLALYLSLKYVRTKKILLLISACFVLFIGMLAKENALTWLAIIPMSLYFFTKSSWKTIGIVASALFATVVVYMIMRSQILGFVFSSGQESTDIMNNPFYGLDPGKKAATISYTLGMYVKLLLYPHPLTHDYYPYQIPIMKFTNWKALFSIIINLSLLLYALFGLKKKSPISYGILFYFITLSVVSNILINVGTTMNERFVYMPSVGLCIILGYFIARWLPAKLNEKENEINILAVGLFTILVIGYTYKTLDRVPDWKNALTLNRAAVKYSPNSARANCFMGVAIFEEYKIETDNAKKESMLAESSIYINQALDIYPAYGSALTMKAGILAEEYKKDYDIDKLLKGFTEVLQFRKTTPFIDEYIEYLIEQNRNPEKVQRFLYTVGYAINYEQRADFNTALHFLNYAYQVNPSNQNVIQGLINCYQGLGNNAKANEFRQQLNR